MSFWSYAGRLLLNILKHPGVQDIASKAARYAIRQATAAAVREVRRRTVSRKSPETSH